MTEISRKNSATVKMAVEWVRTAVKKKSCRRVILLLRWITRS